MSLTNVETMLFKQCKPDFSDVIAPKDSIGAALLLAVVCTAAALGGLFQLSVADP